MSTHGLDLTAARTNSVPEYLRDRSEGFYIQVALASVLLLALGLVTWKIIGPWEQVQSLFNPAQVASAGGDPIKSSAESTAKEPVPSTKTDASSVVASDSRVVDKEPSDTPPLQATDAAIVGEEVAPPVVATTTETAPAESESIATTDAAMTDVATTITETTITADTSSPLPTATDGAAIVADDASPVPTDTPTPESGDVEASKPNGTIAWQPESKDSASAVVMAYSLDDAEGAMLRMANIAEVLPVRTRVIVPDAYRTELRLAPGLKWTVASATDLQSADGDEPKTAYARLRIGRALINATADCDGLVLHVGSDQFKLRMDSATAVASIEVRYFMRTGVGIQDIVDKSKADDSLTASQLAMPLSRLDLCRGICRYPSVRAKAGLCPMIFHLALSLLMLTANEKFHSSSKRFHGGIARVLSDQLMLEPLAT